jgi:hypothetical protein
MRIWHAPRQGGQAVQTIACLSNCNGKLLPGSHSGPPADCPAPPASATVGAALCAARRGWAPWGI